MASLSCYGARALLVAILALFASAAQAQTTIKLVGNLDSPNSFTFFDSGQFAQRFETGSNTSGYTLESVEFAYRDSEGDTVSAKVCTIASGHTPTSTCTDLTAPTSFASGNISFTAEGGMRLEPSTRYTLVLNSANNITHLPSDENVSETDDSDSLSDWDMVGKYSVLRGSTWSGQLSHSLGIALRGFVNEMPASPQARLDSLTVTPVTGTLLSFNPAFRPGRRGPYTAWVTQDATEVTLAGEVNGPGTRVDWPDDVNPNEPGVQIAVPPGGTERYRIPVRNVELPCTREDLANGFCTWYWLTVRRHDGALTGKLRALPPPPATRGAAPPHFHRFRVVLSAPVELSLEAWKNDVFTVSNGTITDAKRIGGAAAGPGGDPVSTTWELTVDPDDEMQETVIAYTAKEDCSRTGAVCTAGRNMLDRLDSLAVGLTASIADTSVFSGDTQAVFTVSLSFPSKRWVWVDFESIESDDGNACMATPGTATPATANTAGGEYWPQTTRLMIPPGKTSVRAGVGVTDDSFGGGGTVRACISNVRIMDGSTEKYRVSTTRNVAEARSRSDCDNTKDTKCTIEVDSKVTSNLESRGDRDWFRVEFEQGKTYVIFMPDSAEDSGVGIAPEIFGIHDEDGTLIAGIAQSEEYEGSAVQVVYTPTRTGVHYIHVGSKNDNYANRYKLSVALDRCTAGTDTACTVAVGGAVVGTMEYAADGDAETDWYKVEFEQGKHYRIDLKGRDTDSSLTLPDPWIPGIYDNDGAAIGNTEDINSGEGHDSRVYYQATRTGVHYLAVSVYEFFYHYELGTYRLEVVAFDDDCPTATDTPCSVEVGGSIDGTIEVRNDEDWHEVSFVRGTTYLMTVKGADSDNSLTLDNPHAADVYNYNGDLYGTAGSFDSGADGHNLVFTAEYTGVHFISVDGEGTSTGTYRLEVTEPDDDCAAATDTSCSVEVGGSVDGEIELRGDLDWYEVQFVSGRKYRIDLMGESPLTLDDAFFYGIYDDNGVHINNTQDDDGGTDNDSRVEYTATRTGAHYLSAGGYDATQEGTYRLEVTDITNNRSVETVEPGTKGLTAAFESVPQEHDGSSAFELRVVFSKELVSATGGPGTGGRARVTRSLAVSGGSVGKVWKASPPRRDEFRIRVTPTGHEAVSLSLAAVSDCTHADALCTPGAKPLSKPVSVTIPGPPGLSVADAAVDEGPDATLDFVVTMDRAAPRAVTVNYESVDGTAVAAEDYERAYGMLTFAAGETEKTVSVRVLDDAHDEDDETMTLRLSDPVGAWLADREAVGTIRNTDLMPQAWLARFGRTVADQVIDAVAGRMSAPRGAGTEVTVAGQRVEAGAAPADLEDREAAARMAALTAWFRGAEEDTARSALETRGVTSRDLLTGSSFALTGGSAESGFGAVWGRGALSRFDGREGALTLDGEVESALLGADWSAGRMVAGLALSHSRGEGGYRSPQGDGAVSATLTGVYPYGRYDVDERLSLWGVVGFGTGSLTLTPEGMDPIETDMALRMAAAGLRSVLVEAPADGGFELAATSDAMAVETTSDEVRGNRGSLAASEAGVTRLRAGLEGRWRGIGSLEPSFEIGVRQDGGDAETGFGADIGAGLTWREPALGIEAGLDARGLLTHEDGGFRERGFAGSFAWDPDPASDLGPKLALRQTVGASATGGVDALLRPDSAQGLLAVNDDEGDDLGNRRLEAELGYGLSTFGGRYTTTPAVGFGLTEADREYSHSWRLAEAKRPGLVFGLDVEAVRLERVGGDAAPEHRFVLGLGWRLEGARRAGTSFEVRLEGARSDVANDDAGPKSLIGARLSTRW